MLYFVVINGKCQFVCQDQANPIPTSTAAQDLSKALQTHPTESSPSSNFDEVVTKGLSNLIDSVSDRSKTAQTVIDHNQSSDNVDPDKISTSKNVSTGVVPIARIGAGRESEVFKAEWMGVTV